MTCRSTITNLTLFTNSIFSSFNRNNQLDEIYLDFRKTFDLINHNILLLKLKEYNFPTSIIGWFENYLFDRNSYEQIKGTKSRKYYYIATSGVPQTSHLGLLLFLLFIKDFPHVIEFSNILLFADDIKLYLEISNVQDCLKMQSHLYKLMNWCNANLLFLNFDKCLTISFSRSANHVVFNYLLKINTSCGRVDSIKDLGVIFDSKLTFNEQLDYVISRTNRIWGLVFRNTKSFKNPESIKYLYIT